MSPRKKKEATQETTPSPIQKAIDAVRITAEACQEQGPEILYGNTPVRMLGIESEVAELRTACDLDGIPDESRHTVLATDAFLTEYDRWVETLDTEEPESPAGSTPVWNTLGAMVAAMEPLRDTSLEPIRQLADAGVGPKQIANMYGWWLDGKKENGPDLAKVSQAMADKDFKPPRAPKDIEREASIDRRWQERTDRREAEAVKNVPPPPAPESLDDLLSLGRDDGGTPLTARQIQKILRDLTEDEILSRANERGLLMQEPGVSLSERPPMGAEKEQAAQKAAQESHTRRQEQVETLSHVDEGLGDIDPSDGDTMVLRIEGLSEQGMKPPTIAETLRNDYPGLTPQEVTRVLETDKEVTAP